MSGHNGDVTSVTLPSRDSNVAVTMYQSDSSMSQLDSSDVSESAHIHLHSTPSLKNTFKVLLASLEGARLRETPMCVF